MLKVVEMQVSMDYLNEMDTASFGKVSSMLESNIAVHAYNACTCQCTQKFSQSGTYLVDNPVLDVEIYAGDWSIVS
jgi:hypothetical protein